MEKLPPTADKSCVVCSKTFSKAYTTSRKMWATAKFCSIRCSTDARLKNPAWHARMREKVLGKYLNADHIKSWAEYPELRFDLSNGRTLCLDCHKRTPNYGWSAMWAKRRAVTA